MALPELALADKVVVLDRTLRDAGINHAFGGALALAYYAEPRATVDIDINLFVPPDRYKSVVAVLRPLDVERIPPEDVVLRDGQARVWWGRTPLDLFFAYDPIHEAMRTGARLVPFGEGQIPILAPEHLLVAKVLFNRAKDWLDIEQMLVAVPDLDLGEADRWLDRFLADHDARVDRLRVLAAGLWGP